MVRASVLVLAVAGCGFDSSGVSGSASDSVGSSGETTGGPETSGDPPTTTSASTSASTTTTASTTDTPTSTTDDPTLTTSMSSSADDDTSASDTSSGTEPTLGTSGDDDATTSPVNTEVCDGFDNDGDGGVDEGSAENASCDGCSFFLGATGEYWFSICGDLRTYDQARERCGGFVGDLAKIEQLEDQVTLLGAVGEDHWIGIDDRQVEGTWLWVDGTISNVGGVPMGFDGWNPSQPSGGLAENCAEMDPGQAGWADSPCEQAQPYICRHPD